MGWSGVCGTERERDKDTAGGVGSSNQKVPSISTSHWQEELNKLPNLANHKTGGGDVWFCPQGDIWQSLETFLVISSGRRVPLAF